MKILFNPPVQEIKFVFDPQNLATLFGYFALFLCLAIALQQAVQAFNYLRGQTPTAKIQKLIEERFKQYDLRFSEIDSKLTNDYNHLEIIESRLAKFESSLETDSKRSEENFKVLSKGLVAIIEHMRTGNGIEQLRKEQEDLTNYFIDRK